MQGKLARTISLSLLIVIIASTIAPQIFTAHAAVAVNDPNFVAETLASGLNGPFGLAFDKTGNLYVANEGSGGVVGTTVSKITPEGQVSTYATGFNAPAGLTFDKSGNLWVSDDGHSSGQKSGNIWKIAPDGTVTLGTTYVFGNPNAIGFDDKWNLFVAAQGGDIWKVSPTGKVSLFASGFIGPQAVAVDNAGYVFTADQDGKIWKLNPSGKQRTLFAQINGNSGNFAFDQDGNLYAPDNGGQLVKISPDGVAQPFMTGLVWPRGVAFDSTGRMYISDCGGGAVWRVRMLWTKEEIISSKHNVGQWTSLALDSADLPHVSYTDPENGDLKYAEWGTGVGGYSGWLVRETVEEDAFSVGTSLVLDSAGNPRISYYKKSSWAGSLKYARWNGDKWIIETVDSKGDVGMYSSLALDSAGNPCISYYDYTNKDLKYARWRYYRWQVETVDSKGDVGMYSSLALDSAGNPCISYYDAQKGDLKYASWDGRKWQISTVDSVGDVGQYSSLALGADGVPRISYYDASNGDLKYAIWKGSAWGMGAVDSVGDVGKFSSLAADSVGNPCISYYDSTNADLKYTCWDGANWVTTPVDVVGDVGQFSSLALGSDGRPQVTYYDATNGYLKRAYLPISTPFEDNFEVNRIVSAPIPYPAQTATTDVYVRDSNGEVYDFYPGGGYLKWGASVDPPSLTASGGVSSPVLVTVNSQAFALLVTSESGKVYAIDANTGAIMWTYSTGDSSLSTVSTHLVPNANPYCLYVSSSSGKVYALDLHTGQERWIFSTGETTELSSPLSYTYLLPGKSAPDYSYAAYVATGSGKVYAIDSATGLKMWDYSMSSDSISLTTSRPTISGAGIMYVSSESGKVYALDPLLGTEIWVHPTGDSGGLHTPIVYPTSGGPQTVYVSSGSGKVYALNPVSGAEKFPFFDTGISEELSVPGTYTQGGILAVYVVSESGKVYSLNPSLSGANWVYSMGEGVVLFPVGSPVFGGPIGYLSSMTGRIHAFNVATGTQTWVYSTNDNVMLSRPAFTNVAGDGTLFVGSNAGKLIALFGGNGGERWVNLIAANFWRVDYPSWAVQNGKLTPTSLASAPSFNNRPTVITYRVFSGNFRIETKYTRLSAEGLTASIIFKYQIVSNFKNYLSVVLFSNQIAIEQVRGGNLMLPIAAFNYAFELDREYSIKVEVYGSRIDVYVDNMLACSDSSIAANYPYSSGGIGFNINGAPVTFDDVKVSALMQTEIVDSGTLGGPAVKLDSKGNPHMMIPDPSRGYWIYAEQTRCGWKTEIAAKGRLASGSFIFALDSNGNPCLLHYQPSTGKLLYTTKTWGIWSTKVIAEQSVGLPPTNPSLALDSNNKPCVTYFNRDTAELKYAAMVSGWNPQTVFSAQGYNGGASSLALDSSNRPYISFVDTSNAKLMYAYRDNDGNWISEIAGPLPTLFTGPFTVVDAANTPHIILCDRTPSVLALEYGTRTGSSWSFELVDQGAANGLYSAAVDSAGNPYACYRTSSGELKVAQRTTSSWSIYSFGPLNALAPTLQIGMNSNVFVPSGNGVSGTLRISYIDSVQKQVMYATSSIP